MTVLEKMLALRPTNAAARLGATSTLPLLNPRDLVRGLGADPTALLCVPVPALEVIPGVIRAAREVDAALGLACAYPQQSRNGAARFFEALRAVADEIDHRRPVFLQAGPIRIAGAVEPRVEEQVTADLYRFIDAGFSLVSLDAAGLALGQGAKLTATLAQPAMERELAVEVAAPLESDGRPTAEGLKRYLGALAAGGLEPNFVRVRSTLFIARAVDGGEVEGDLGLLSALAGVAMEHGAALSIEDHGTSGRLMPMWQVAGARKVDAGEPFARLVQGARTAEQRSAVEAQSAAEKIPAAELLGREERALAEGAAAERVEALSFGEGLELIRALGSEGSATRIMRFLADRAGY